MSGLEIISAVLAIVGGLQTGRQLFSEYRARRRKKAQAKLLAASAGEEDPGVEKSLVVAESGVRSGYDGFYRSYGENFKRGDGMCTVLLGSMHPHFYLKINREENKLIKE